MANNEPKNAVISFVYDDGKDIFVETIYKGRKKTKRICKKHLGDRLELGTKKDMITNLLVTHFSDLAEYILAEFFPEDVSKNED